MTGSSGVLSRHPLLVGDRPAPATDRPVADRDAVVTVLDDAGSPVAGARVRFWPDGGFALAGETDGSGRFRMRGWPVGSAGELRVQPPSSSEWTLMRWEAAAWRPRDQIVRLARGAVTVGVVRDVEHRPIGNADVEIEALGSDGTCDSAARATANGEFRLLPRPSGVVTLRALARGERIVLMGKARTPHVSDVLGPAGEVVVGARDVALPVDLGLPLRVRFGRWPTVSPTIDAVIVPELARTETRELDFAAPSAEAPVAADGTVDFAQLDRGQTYTLWVGPV